MTLCESCLPLFLDVCNYRVRFIGNCKPIYDREPHECECDICGRHGHDYDVEKISNIHK